MCTRPALPFLLCLLLVLPVKTRAEEHPSPPSPLLVEARVVKAAYVYNFTKFVDWHLDAGTADAPPITICVVGSDPVGSALDEISTLQARGRAIKVLHVVDGDAIPPCDLLYISSSAAAQLPRILSQVEKSTVLTVSDIPHFIDQGGMIGFVLERGRVRIEINVPRVRLAGLTVSSKLLEIARNVTKGES